MKREVMHKILNYIGYGVAAIAIIVVIVCAEILSREHRASQPVTKLKINITGGGEHPLADVESIDKWIKEAGLVKHNTTLETLNIGDIELRAKEHNAVAQANAHVDYNGTAVLDITLREPIARLRVNGYDQYITADGFILPTVEDATAARAIAPDIKLLSFAKKSQNRGLPFIIPLNLTKVNTNKALTGKIFAIKENTDSIERSRRYFNIYVLTHSEDFF